MSQQRSIARMAAFASAAFAFSLSSADPIMADDVRDEHAEPEVAAEKHADPSEKAPKASERDVSVSNTGPPSAADPLYVLPKVGKPRHRVGGGRRGAGADLPEIYALVPEHVGQTSAEQPVLYWYLSAAAPERVRFELTLNDEESIDPIIDTTVLSPMSPGLQRFSLAEHGVSLRPGEEYQWSVAIVSDDENRSNDLVSSGWVERVAMPAEIGALAGSAEGGERVRVFGRAGLWYDALDAAYQDMLTHPDDAEARSRFEQLLQEASLPATTVGSADR